MLFTLHAGKKADTNPSVHLSAYNELVSKFPSYTRIYTDGSKDGEKAASAFTSGNHTTSLRLPDNTSIFSAEIKAIALALNFIKHNNIKNAIIFSDSLSVLQSLHYRNLENTLLRRLLVKHTKLSTTHNIIYCWLPSHIGIAGNEKADHAAKQALSELPTDFTLPYSDFKPCITKYLFNKWQTSWNDAVQNKLHTLKPVLGEWKHSCRTDRREEVVLARLRIGHSHITHSFILKGEEPPECVSCNEPFTVKHVLIDCIDCQLTRDRYYRVQDTKELFDTVNVSAIFDFLKEINLYYKI